MRAWLLERVGEGRRLRLVRRPMPSPGAGELLLRLRACGVCGTDGHLVSGAVTPPRLPVVPGHQVVGEVIGSGRGVSGFALGDRVGVGWLASTCGRCRFCRTARENLCPRARFTGFHRDGGFADAMVARADFVYPIPEGFPDASAAPLLCAGIIGYRALRLSEARPGDRLGLYGFGGSAHLVAQLARRRGCEIYAVSRDDAHLARARKLGARWTGKPGERPPEKLDAAILFAPAGELVPEILEALGPGATLAIAGLTLTPIPSLDYDRMLFRERRLTSVTASSREDARELLAEASGAGLKTEIERFPLARASEALSRLIHDRLRGAAAVLLP